MNNISTTSQAYTSVGDVAKISTFYGAGGLHKHILHQLQKTDCTDCKMTELRSDVAVWNIVRNLMNDTNETLWQLDLFREILTFSMQFWNAAGNAFNFYIYVKLLIWKEQTDWDNYTLIVEKTQKRVSKQKTCTCIYTYVSDLREF